MKKKYKKIFWISLSIVLIILMIKFNLFENLKSVVTSNKQVIIEGIGNGGIR